MPVRDPFELDRLTPPVTVPSHGDDTAKGSSWLDFPSAGHACGLLESTAGHPEPTPKRRTRVIAEEVKSKCPSSVQTFRAGSHRTPVQTRRFRTVARRFHLKQLPVFLPMWWLWLDRILKCFWSIVSGAGREDDLFLMNCESRRHCPTRFLKKENITTLVN